MGAAPLRARAQVHGRAQKSAVDGRGAGPARVREARPSKSFFGVKAQSLRSIEKRERKPSSAQSAYNQKFSSHVNIFVTCLIISFNASASTNLRAELFLVALFHL